MDRPINLKAHEVVAILAGRKSQHRVVLKDQATWERVGDAILRRYPRQKSGLPYQPGDRLWCRETWAWSPFASMPPSPEYPQFLDYRAAHEEETAAGPRVDSKWRPSTTLPRWASRITLLVTDVRVERLHALTDDDAKAEGLEWVAPTYGISGMAETWSASPREAFRGLWNSIHGYAAWPANPFVTVLSFRPIRANIDAPEAQEAA